jgi:PAS domain S-box-containing protein
LAILFLILLGASWFLYGVRPEFSWFRIQAGAVGVLVVILTSLTIYHAVMPGSFSLEALLFPNPAVIHGYLITEMSPIAAVMLFLGGLSLILLVSFSGTRTRTSAALFGIVIFSCGVVTSTGYLYQAPLLYGSSLRPVSTLAGIAFLFLGAEIWGAAGRECWPTRTLVGRSVQARLLRAFLPVVALTLVVLLGIDQILPDEYVTPLLDSLELLVGLVAVIIVIGRLSRGIGGEIDQSIAERKRLQEELQNHSLHLEELVGERTRGLRESEEKYRDLFEACPVSLWEEDFSAVKQFVDELREKGVSDFDAYFANHPMNVAKCAGLVKVLNVNKATLNLYDAKSMDEIVGGLSGVLTEETNHAFVGEVLALVQGKKYYEAEFKNKTLRGETKHCNVICAVVPGYEQSLAKVLICIEDLTHQKKLEENLRAASDRLDYIVSSNPAVIQLGKPLPGGSDFISIYLSQSVSSLLGFGPEELTGQSGTALWQSRVPHDDLQQYKAQMPLLWRDGHHTFEYRFLHKDGSIRWMHEEDRVIRDSEGQVRDVVGYFTDETERKRLEEELRAAKERLEYVIASNPAVLVLEKPLPDLSNTYSTFVSESATFVLGFEPKNFLGEAGAEFWKTRVPPDDLARYLAEMPKLWKDGHHVFQFRFLHSDGAYRWIREEMKLTHDAEGHILDVVGVGIDVTERKNLEEKLAKAERLAVIGETAAMVGHDLRNPLQGITGALHLLRQESLTAEERAEMLQVIENSVHYSDAIIKDLSDYSAEIKLKLIPTTLKSIIRDAILAVKTPQNVTVQDLSEDHPPFRVDPDSMKRAFINLIGNAIGAMPQGGILTISSKKSDGNVEIALTDTGLGMSENVMGNLWKPFQTTKAKGMGLGLAICKRIVEAHGGNISVKSKEGEGTTMTIRLPIKLETVEVTQK